MPENFVYVRILQMIADPRLREDDEERAGMTKVGGGSRVEKECYITVYGYIYS